MSRSPRLTLTQGGKAIFISCSRRMLHLIVRYREKKWPKSPGLGTSVTASTPRAEAAIGTKVKETRWPRTVTGHQRGWLQAETWSWSQVRRDGLHGSQEAERGRGKGPNKSLLGARPMTACSGQAHSCGSSVSDRAIKLSVCPQINPPRERAPRDPALSQSLLRALLRGDQRSTRHLLGT